MLTVFASAMSAFSISNVLFLSVQNKIKPVSYVCKSDLLRDGAMKTNAFQTHSNLAPNKNVQPFGPSAFLVFQFSAVF